MHRVSFFPWAVFAALTVAAIFASSPTTAAELDMDLLAPMTARAIGPAAMSGRVAAIDVVLEDPETLYVGAATGGLWKSVDGGASWTPIFDDQPVAAIGAVAVFQPSPDIVWVGTGEGNPRNSASVGNGIYKSLDGGRSWSHLGLEGTERIHRILLHPKDPQVAYVAALGRTWGENRQRGVFKTTDGGASWSQVLFVDETTGAADLAMDPTNPDKLIAALWDHRRWPWFFRSGGPGSGLHLTIDGGATWRRLTEADGLPAGELGRAGVAFAPSDPSVVYALVEAETSALLRSEDGGFHWTKVNESPEIAPRPFYYADLRVDPQREDRVYSLWSRLSASDDGGKSFSVVADFATVHPDHHALWIHPRDPDFLINGNDGGISISRDRGKSWRFLGNLPLAQYYHVRVDDDLPYNVYGGLQDNGSWRGPSEVWENGGIRNHHWQEVNFGDGFDTVPDPTDSRRGYAMSQEGYLVRWDLHTGERRSVRPAAPPGDELRFNWDAGIALDPFDDTGRTVYFGSQYLHRSTDGGESWTTLSPDLTTDNPEWQRQAESGGLTPDVTGAENFTSIVTISPSPVEEGVLWVGTDDGRIHVTRDAGGSWESVEGRLPGVPANSWVPNIEASPHNGGTAFVVLDNHRRSDWTPYVLRTDDYGRNWTSLATDDLRGYALSIVQDPVEERLLFLGTEFGLFVSLDGGGGWHPWRHGVPTVSVMDLAFQRREHDLVLGTHGRGIFILDDVRPLRGLTAAALERPLHLFEAGPAQQYRVAQTGSSRFPGTPEFRGTNTPYGATLTFSVAGGELPFAVEERERQRRAARTAEAGGSAGAPQGGSENSSSEEEPPTAEIRIADESGTVVRTLEHPVTRGLNRVTWNLRRDAFRAPPGPKSWWRDEESGPEVLPGRYTVTIRFGDQEASTSLTVLPDPRVEVSMEERRAKEAAILRTGALREAAAEAVSRIHDVRDDVEATMAKAKRDQERQASQREPGTDAEEEAHSQLLETAEVLLTKLAEVEAGFVQPAETKGIPKETHVVSRLNEAQYFLESSWNAPTAAEQRYLEIAEETLEAALGALDQLLAEDVATFRELVAEAGGLGFLRPATAPIGE